MRIGVTGHRRYSEPVIVDAQVDALLDRLLSGGAAATDTAAPIAVSSLAEGADRLLVHHLLARGTTVVDVVLPLGADDYRQDFATPSSRTEFDALLATATTVVVVDAPAGASRTVRYQLAGRAVVDRCDVLVAVWDGEPARGQGGTAEIVAYARERAVPVEVVAVRREPAR